MSSRELSESQAAVLDELQVEGDTGVGSMYRRALDAVRTRLIMDDEYDPAENMSLVRVLTMLGRDLAVLCGAVPEGSTED